ncbi:helix-turn-helix domain-containing protein [Arcanobacterium bovis]|uniref:XRE family transcriptional regulator n=1 Tax=Arcanobacterium bovis TaxID=2529275 RepID=A0A4Q9V0Q4_9ACTO|nr:helix-turn-helix transcriptional regulator [Arcanobacterium bovis]TBW22243.1 XRE family transcriptional regulator [Arcanobacterium bovis]
MTLNQERRASVKAKREQARRDRELIEDLVAMRLRKGLTHQNVADKLSVSQSTISRFEARVTNPSQQFIRRYALAVGAGIKYEIVDSSPIYEQNFAVDQRYQISETSIYMSDAPSFQIKV